MHKSLHFWLYAAAVAWWAIELYAQNGDSGNFAVGPYGTLASIDTALPGNTMLPSFIPAGTVYLFAAGAIAHKMGH